jgi:hypothetical protein
MNFEHNLCCDILYVLLFDIYPSFCFVIRPKANKSCQSIFWGQWELTALRWILLLDNNPKAHQNLNTCYNKQHLKLPAAPPIFLTTYSYYAVNWWWALCTIAGSCPVGGVSSLVDQFSWSHVKGELQVEIVPPLFLSLIRAFKQSIFMCKREVQVWHNPSFIIVSLRNYNKQIKHPSWNTHLL